MICSTIICRVIVWNVLTGEAFHRDGLGPPFRRKSHLILSLESYIVSKQKHVFSLFLGYFHNMGRREFFAFSVLSKCSNPGTLVVFWMQVGHALSKHAEIEIECHLKCFHNHTSISVLSFVVQNWIFTWFFVPIKDDPPVQNITCSWPVYQIVFFSFYRGNVANQEHWTCQNALFSQSFLSTCWTQTDTCQT